MSQSHRRTPGVDALLGLDLQQMEEPSLFQKLRESRGWTQQYLDEINDPSFDRLQNMDQMIEALHQIRLRGEQIVVLPDFDMDGVTSGVLGWAGLNELGFDAQLYVPDHRRGHDISVEAIQELQRQYPQATAVITCDGGINSNTGITYGRSQGLTMLVTDHHLELPPGSQAHVAVNPARIGETYSHPGICGAVVLWQVLLAYAQRHDPQRSADISRLKLFAGIGTVSDVMPMFYENRQIVRDSVSMARLLYVNLPAADRATDYDAEKAVMMRLLRLHNSHSPQYISAFEGFALCLRQFREHRKLRSIEDLSEQFYGFYLSPAFNAIRRVDADMADAFGAFTAPTQQQKLAHIDQVIATNELRKELTVEHMERLDETEQPYQPYLWHTDAPKGMLGLIASKLMHAHGHPVVVLGADGLSGSARAPFWYPVITTLSEAGFTAVGHEQACGVMVGSSDQLDALAQTLESTSEQLYQQALNDGSLDAAYSGDLVLGSTHRADGRLDDPEALLELTRSIEALQPFGQGFPRPQFELVVNLSHCSISTLGEEKTHLRIVLSSGVKLLWWNAAERLRELQELADSPMPGAAVVSFLATFSLNNFMGETTVQATIDTMLDKPGSPEFDEIDGVDAIAFNG